MGFRFWRRMKLAPGVSMNLSKSGGSLSFGPRGGKWTIGGRGQRLTAGLPGTGLFYTTTSSPRGSGSGNEPAQMEVAAEDRLDLGFFRRLVTPEEEKALVDGCREFVLGREETALTYLAAAYQHADAAFLAGFIALKRGDRDRARSLLEAAAADHASLGRYFDKYGIAPTLSLAITPQVTAHVGASIRGVLLGLTEIYQAQGDLRQATASIRRLRQIEPDDGLVTLSLVELLSETGEETAKEVVSLVDVEENRTEVETALLYYKGMALRRLKMPTAARDTLTRALRRKKNRPRDLRRAVRYERALTYETLGQRRRARAELERIYADEPSFADVAQRLGVS